MRLLTKLFAETISVLLCLAVVVYSIYRTTGGDIVGLALKHAGVLL